MEKYKAIGKLICIGLLAVGLFMLIFSGTVGNNAGEMYGKTVGVGVGSFKGVSEYKKAYDEGRSEAEQVEDTTVSAGTSLDTNGEKLQVLIAKTTLRNFLKYSDETLNWEKFSKLEVLDIDVVFTVDLSKAKITDNNIIIPYPEVSLYNDESGRKVIATYQALPFIDSAEDGINIALNSMKQIMSNAKDTLYNYDELYSQAKESAQRQVAMLYRSLNTDGKELHVYFDTETEG